MKRYCQSFIENDLKKKMVFIGGPRQVGKTTLAKTVCKNFHEPYEYFTWDLAEDRKAILKKKWRSDSHFVIFDELHKYPRWKNWIKGVFDTRKNNQEYIVTGSARLDIYRQGGDSLLGRYHYWRLHPFTLDELPKNITREEGYERLLTLGGFPEPFISNDVREARRWRRERFDRVLREDVRDLERIREIQLLFLFVDALRDRVGGMINVSNLAQDLEISPKTAKSWLNLIQRMYIGFAVTPYSKGVLRSIRKPTKFYFYDNADVANGESARLENLVATHLLKRLHFMEDYFGYRCSLHYIRDKDNREVDFVTVIDGVVHDLIEVKMSEDEISSALKYYAEKLHPKRTIQIVGNLKKSYDQNGVRVTSPIEFFVDPPWDVEKIS